MGVHDDPTLGFELSEKRRARVRRQNMKRRAFEPVRFDPFHGSLEYVRPVVIEPEHETAVDLDSIPMQ